MTDLYMNIDDEQISVIDTEEYPCSNSDTRPPPAHFPSSPVNQNDMPDVCYIDRERVLYIGLIQEYKVCTYLLITTRYSKQKTQKINPRISGN